MACSSLSNINSANYRNNGTLFGLLGSKSAKRAEFHSFEKNERRGMDYSKTRAVGSFGTGRRQVGKVKNDRSSAKGGGWGR